MAAKTTIHELPPVILSTIFSLVTDTRSRNNLSLVCRNYRDMERATRESLTLRGNPREFFLLRNCFRSVTRLDLSLLSPWGDSLSTLPSDHLQLLAYRLRDVFPNIHSLTVYCRSPSTLELLLPSWPQLRRLKLVRWHQRPQILTGADFIPVFQHCPVLESLDLSEFNHWTEDLPPVLAEYPAVSDGIKQLNLLKASLIEGFKSNEIIAITKACPNLTSFIVACSFDPRHIGFVGDETLLAVATNCPKLTLLHMADTTTLSTHRANLDLDFDQESGDARITTANLMEVFTALPLLEELVLDLGRTLRDSGVVFEAAKSKSKNLKVLKLGNFHGVCKAADWKQPDGVALLAGLESLSIRNADDMQDLGLVAIGKGCCKLAKIEIHGCNNISVHGVRTLASLLRETLVEVKISCCRKIDASATIRAVEPICRRIRRLHLDCIWGTEDDDAVHETKRLKYSSDYQEGCLDPESDDNGLADRRWDNLQYLSLWLSVGEDLNPLTLLGLNDCPNLEEVDIKIEGDCRGRQRIQGELGLSCLSLYPKLSKMRLDCGDTIGYILTAPCGQKDLSSWERFFLSGIENLRLEELDYWPPQDRDVNRRSVSLPAIGLLAQCVTLRRLFIHGTTHEHFMGMLWKIPNLRDGQLRADYYPAPDSDSTEMREGSCTRFEAALNNRRIID